LHRGLFVFKTGDARLFKFGVNASCDATKLAIQAN
jgi:hypothetical protein